MLTILFDGVAYGMLLFVLASGLSVTLGLMNFINLAHGAFAMVGGYVTALLMNRAGVPFLVTLPAAFLIPAILGVALERTLYRRLYGASPLDQVLFTIGLVLMAMPIADYLLGDEPQQVNLPAWLVGQRRSSWRRHRRLSAVHHRRLRRHRRDPADLPRQDPLRRAIAGGGRRRARRRRARDQRRPHLRRSPSRSAAGSRAWAARSPPTSSAASIRPFRSNSW